MSDPPQAPVHQASALASWRQDTPVPKAAGDLLTVRLASLRDLSTVRKQVRAFLLASVPVDGIRPTVTFEEAVERAILVIDELAHNALRHGSPPSTLSVGDEEGRWIVVVSDGAPDRPPTPARNRPAGQGGYGLYLIADFSVAHSIHHERHRKSVWACLDKR